MSEFLLVAPEGWQQLEVASSGMSSDTIQCSSMQTITEMLRIAGMIGEQDIVEEVRIFGNESFFIRLA